MGEVTQQMDQASAVALGFPPLKYTEPTFPKCGVWPLCNRTGEFNPHYFHFLIGLSEIEANKRS